MAYTSPSNDAADLQSVTYLPPGNDYVGFTLGGQADPTSFVTMSGTLSGVGELSGVGTVISYEYIPPSSDAADLQSVEYGPPGNDEVNFTLGGEPNEPYPRVYASGTFKGVGQLYGVFERSIQTFSYVNNLSADTTILGDVFKIKEQIILEGVDPDNVESVSVYTQSQDYKLSQNIDDITVNEETGEVVIDLTITVDASDAPDGDGTVSGGYTGYVETTSGTAAPSGGGISAQPQSYTSGGGGSAPSGTNYTADDSGTATSPTGETVASETTESTGSSSISSSSSIDTTESPSGGGSVSTTRDTANSGGTATAGSGEYTPPEDDGEQIQYPVTFTQRVCTEFKDLSGYNGVEAETSSSTNPISHKVLSVEKNPSGQPEGTVCTTVRISLHEPQGVQEVPAKFSLVVDYAFGSDVGETEGGVSVSDGVRIGNVKGATAGGAKNMYGIGIGRVIRGFLG